MSESSSLGAVDGLQGHGREPAQQTLRPPAPGALRRPAPKALRRPALAVPCASALLLAWACGSEPGSTSTSPEVAQGSSLPGAAPGMSPTTEGNAAPPTPSFPPRRPAEQAAETR